MSTRSLRRLRQKWGRLSTCGGLATRQRRLTTGAQDAILPHKAHSSLSHSGGADGFA
jgi:hypothetical protein